MAGTVITKKGLQLIAKLVASGTALTFTRASVGTGSVPAGYDPGSMTNLNNYKMDGSISSCSASGDEASIIMQISSLGVDTGFTITETGLFATDPDEGEILYAYLDLSMDPQYVYAENSAISKFVELTLVVKVGTVERVTAQLNPRSLLTRDGDISETAVETLEPVETKFPIPSAGESIKRFLGNVRTCLKNIKPLEANVSVYVATTGSNTTGDGSETAPYRTIPYALSTIPKDLGGYTATFIVADGTYNEPVNIIGYCGGYIILKRNGSQELNSACNINSIRVEYCDSVSVSGFNLTNTEGTSIFTSMCEFVNLAYCQSIVATETNEVSFNFDYVAVGRIVGCRSLNHYTCLRSYSSNVTSHNWSDDSQGSIGIFSDGGGRVARGNIFQPKGSIADEVHPGGGINVNQFGASIGTLPYNTTLYVSPTGSDETGNGTQEKPFRTIQKALNILPKDLGGYNATIIIDNGIYSGDVIVDGSYNGNLIIKSTTPDMISSNVKIDRLIIKYCLARISILGIKIMDGASDAAVSVLDSNNVYLHYLQITTTSSQTGIYVVTTNKIRLYHCDITQRGKAIEFVDSSGYVSACTGASNTIGIVASGESSIHIISTIPGATTPTQSLIGAMFIRENGTQISELVNSGFSCAWGTISGGIVRNGITGGTGIITIQMDILLTTALTSDVEYTISGFPNPSTVAVAVTCDSQRITNYCLLGADGIIHWQPNTNIPSGNRIRFNCTYLTKS